jgi:hypothetical protein
MVIGEKNPDGTLIIHGKSSLSSNNTFNAFHKKHPENISNSILHFCNTVPKKNTITQKGGFTPLSNSDDGAFSG